MNFVKQEIKPKIVGIIDIGTFKIRVGICKIINRDVELVGYGEKRQEDDYIEMQEIQNLKGVSENISLAIKKAEKDGEIEVNDVIINLPTTNMFFEFSQINHIRENNENKIDDIELYEIMKNVETIALKKHFKSIKELSGYKKSDLKLIISNISKIICDNKETKILLGTNPKVVNISLLNVFIPESKYEIIDYIKKSIKKNIVNIIPSEFAITGLFKEVRDVVIIDIGNSHTSIIVKKDDNIKSAKKLAFGINDLIKQIRKNFNLTKNEIIRTIDMDRFLTEKANFLAIFKDVLSITLDEILGGEICPNNFFMIGGGANKFVKNYLKSINLNDWNLKIVGNVKFINPKIDFLDDKIENNDEWIDTAKSNVNIYAMIKTTLDFIKKDKNKIEKTLKQVIHDLDA
ncbi:MAG: hypothetical protein Q8K30_04405 [Candidatus Gracilibacteria bacterium]|nr:hypothetical protein [Candidatus Gracilibacteria bacterium]